MKGVLSLGSLFRTFCASLLYFLTSLSTTRYLMSARHCIKGRGDLCASVDNKLETLAEHFCLECKRLPALIFSVFTNEHLVCPSLDTTSLFGNAMIVSIDKKLHVILEHLGVSSMSLLSPFLVRIY
jgi:hypothetical protein